MERRKPINVSDAIQQITNRAEQGTVETVPLFASLHRYLAEDLIADSPVPPFDRSAYDGYAVRSADTAAASPESPVYLKVIDVIGAGTISERTVGANEAVRIMTGAPIPEGADAVVMLELAAEMEDRGRSGIVLKRPLRAGENLSRRGEDIAEGERIIERGSPITPGMMNVLATFGYDSVKVYRKPVVGILATGSELLQVHEPLVHGKIRNSNTFMLAGQIQNAGGEAVNYGVVSDDFEQSYETITRILSEVDILLTTGGVSVGDFDFIPAILERMNAELLFNKVAMRPGSVTTAGIYGGKWIFGLSGNPSACYVGFELFAAPLIRRISGAASYALPARLKAELLEDVSKPSPVDKFIRGTAESRQGRITVRTGGLDKSGAISSLAETNVLIAIPAGTKGLKKGDQVEVLWLNSPIKGMMNFD
ncbi:molybdopterin molybdotransferase MoeA [Ferviditalea candida]|uniref:Molybdopterin molybdenumtransferase n=1 Tax=Ferviditalea candida TaxID=3108399 RepID=A0ABU5ZJG2_9BACL|nr:gephyrin-like molybdotransferase Glp [Paenibacillaceae bacterium T2]